MPFKIRTNINLTLKNDINVWVRFDDTFNREYFLDTYTIYHRITNQEKRDKILRYLEEELGVKDNILRIKNKSPRKRKNIKLSFKYLFERPEGAETKINGRPFIDDKIHIKIQKVKKLKCIMKDLDLRIMIEKVTREELEAMEEIGQETELNNLMTKPYEPCHSSESEIDPKEYKCTFYNHNGILSAGTCKVTS